MSRQRTTDFEAFLPYCISTRAIAKGRPAKGGKITTTVTLMPSLFHQIQSEARSRGWSFNRMVIFLCDASIDGIE